MSKRQHEREQARARARALAAQAAARRRRQYLGIGLTVVVAAVAVVVGLQLVGDDDAPEVAIEGDASATDTDQQDESEVPSASGDASTAPGDEPSAGASTTTAGSPCPAPGPDTPEPAGTSWETAPEMQIDPEAAYTATIETTCGTVTVDLFASDAPLAVNNFVFLAREGFYDGVIFHRVIDGFMVQGGDPTGTGTGGPGYSFEDELDTVEQHGFGRGMLAMANSGPDTNGSQFFIVQGDASHLTTHTVFGQVTDGMDVVDDIAASETDASDRPTPDVAILSVEIDGP